MFEADKGIGPESAVAGDRAGVLSSLELIPALLLSRVTKASL